MGGQVVRHGGGIDVVPVAVNGADVDHAIRHRWRGVDVVSDGVGPLLRPGGGIEGVHVAIPGAEVDYAAHYRWRGIADRASCLIGPLLLPSRTIERMKGVVLAEGEVDGATSHRWTIIDRGPPCPP